MLLVGCSHAAAAVPTLGQPAGIFARGGQGFGQVQPTVIFNGGDPTGRVTDIRWTSWGASKATGAGTGWYPGANGVAEGHYEPATVVAFDLGRCGGKLMYRAVEWYFPSNGDHFNPRQYEDICKGDYVG
jgi:hypothetical protein